MSTPATSMPIDRPWRSCSTPSGTTPMCSRTAAPWSMPSRPGCERPVRPTAGSIINTGDAGWRRARRAPGRLGRPRHHGRSRRRRLEADVGYRLTVRCSGSAACPDLTRRSGSARCALAGAHNAANAACVAAAAAALGLRGPRDRRWAGLVRGCRPPFRGQGRAGGVLVIDDYGHHPTAIRATIEAVRSRYPGPPRCGWPTSH